MAPPSCDPPGAQADATGALEAVKAAVGALPQDRVAPRFLLAAASDITPSDVDLAFASEAIILGFNQEPGEAVLAAAKQFGARRRPVSGAGPVRARGCSRPPLPDSDCEVLVCQRLLLRARGHQTPSLCATPLARQPVGCWSSSAVIFYRSTKQLAPSKVTVCATWHVWAGALEWQACNTGA